VTTQNSISNFHGHGPCPLCKVALSWCLLVQARIHKRQEKEERMASARAGREDRPQFGARTAMKQKKVRKFLNWLYMWFYFVGFDPFLKDSP
jgi:hypothetical protein